MNILVAFNDGYTMPTKVMLRSLITNNQSEELSIYVLYLSLTDESIQSIYELSNGNEVKIYFVKIDDDMSYLPIPGHFSKEAYIRLFAHSYLDKNLDRILWLDGDMIIRGSLKEYYNQDFEDCLYIADVDAHLGRDSIKHKKIGLPLDVEYINSGVLLINLKGVRETVSNEDIIKYIVQYPERLEYVDQDVFNGLLYKYFKRIDPEHIYNFFSDCITWKNKKYVMNNVHVIHYGSSFKPWKKGYRFYGFSLWWQYALIDNKDLKKTFFSILPSYIKGFCAHCIGNVVKNKCPGLYKKLKKI